MTVKIKTYWIVVAVIALLGLTFYLGSINGRRERDRLSENLSEAQNQLIDTVSHYTVKVRGLEVQVWEQTQIILTQKQAMDAGILDKERLEKLHIKTVQSNTIIKGQLKAARDSLKMTKPDTIIVIENDISVPYLRLPFKDNYTDDNLLLDININTNATWGFNIDMPLDLNVTLGRVKVGFMNQDYKALVTTENPYVGIVHVQSLKIEEDPWYRKGWFKGLTYGLVFGTGVWVGGR